MIVNPATIANRYLDASSHKKSMALMKFLSGVARDLGVGQHVYVVGGAVRNWVLGEPIKDTDIVIDSKALGNGRDSEWFAKQLIRTIPVPVHMATNQYGVALLRVDGDWILDGENLRGEDIEIANARKESYGGDEGKGYKPHMVEPATIEEDVVRREFSFNTLLWRLHDLADGPDKAEIIDLTGCGLRDLKNREMRCPSDPDKTFSDDPTRLLRVVKFTTKYGFTIPPDVKASIRRNAPKLRNAPHSALSNLLINTVLTEPYAKKALYQMKALGLLDVLADMVREVKPFREALASWVGNQRVLLMFDIMDVGLPLMVPLSFLPKEQQEQLRKIALGMDDGEAAEFLGFLRQPGKMWDKDFFLSLARDLGVPQGRMREFGPALQDAARRIILDDPKMAWDPSRLTDQLRVEMRRLF